jgi:putative DNA primase/helicase
VQPERVLDLVPSVTSTRDVPLTDVGNAERLIARHGTDLRYIHPWARWLVWDGRRWRPDDTGEPTRRMKETLRALAADALELDDDQRPRLLKHAIGSERETRIRGALQLAQSEPGVPVLPEQLDADPWLLCCDNGTVDLSTGELHPHRREDLLTKLAPVAYDPTAEAPRWRAFLDQVLEGDEATIEFVRRAVGYSLTGDTSEQVLFLLVGAGANGKSTLIETVRALVGDYGQQAPAETFLEQRESIPNHIARLKGARFVATVETPEGRRLNETMVKRLVGGDSQAARFMRGEWFDFRPTFKAWLATNHLPVIRGTDEAIWRRIRVIPFNITIPEPERDKTLAARLHAELPGILTWAIDGCVEWQISGLPTPDAVRAATAGYREHMDVLGDFIADRCETRPDARATVAELYTAYQYWATHNGDRNPLSSKAFGQNLEERGHHVKRGAGGTRYRLGITLRRSDT